ncbi:MarR family transcriptional regulator [Mycobacterium intermedium]|uniref:MarR family transcriptional regulator n=1 Tax=Mycobacterium intermedium TaxID=28445 RepID=A0A1E3SDR7_MYCIE|nr:MarR family transcriptional regulator [Mycobacterium intermedium]MCV6963969.1 MarR family transcriptional regulator [Mycobacterium intermedium]ODR00270.1 MarR family transcriptional regulator [Mycobacterium intermedium]OPE51825.1 MarR family transcriptional regulator [Mycobacterium intermedium]ORB07894.1 MarR family transcriptional regulator [Mycobacterium intermedium]
MSEVDPAKIWSLNHRLLSSVIASVQSEMGALGLEAKELFVLAEIDEHPYPAELAVALTMPKATVTLYLKKLESAGFVRREIDPTDLRRHRLLLTDNGRQAANEGLALLANEFDKRLSRLGPAQQKELKNLLEEIV